MTSDTAVATVRFVALLAVAAQVNAFLGFTEETSFIYHEPRIEAANARYFDQVTEHYFSQRLDNFDPSNWQAFNMVRNDGNCRQFAFTLSDRLAILPKLRLLPERRADFRGCRRRVAHYSSAHNAGKAHLRPGERTQRSARLH